MMFNCDECEADDQWENSMAFRWCRTCSGDGYLECDCEMGEGQEHRVTVHCFKCENDGIVSCPDCQGEGYPIR